MDKDARLNLSDKDINDLCGATIDTIVKHLAITGELGDTFVFTLRIVKLHYEKEDALLK